MSIVNSEQRSLRGVIDVPGDKSISHRALLLAALATGRSRIHGLSRGHDVARTRSALAQLGVAIADCDGAIEVVGGIHIEPEEPLDCGNSGTGIRLLTGLCAGLDLAVILTGDQYLRRRPMRRVADPLRMMGARIDGRAGGELAPLFVRGGDLSGIEFRSPVSSAQVKSALLLAGLSARGRTTVIEPTISRRHTEEMLVAFGGKVSVDDTAVSVERSNLTATDLRVPGDPSQAAFWIVAALLVPGSEVTISNLYLGRERTGFLDVLQRMGADLQIDHQAGAVTARTSRLRGTDIGAEEIPAVVDEIPILAAAAAFAAGTTRVTDAHELRVKESDRIKTVVAMLDAFGAHVTETADGMVIAGGTALQAGQVDSYGDHRIAMSAAVIALAVQGTTIVEDTEAMSTSYVEFFEHLAYLTGSPDLVANHVS